MRFAAFSLAFAVSAIAFQTAGVAPSKPKREKPTPREKARELLDNAAGISASARPRRAGFRPPLHWREAATAVTAGISLPDAAEMLHQIQPSAGDSGGNHDPRQSANQSVISRMLAKGQIDEATELLTVLGGTGQYPYRRTPDLRKACAR